MHRSSKGMRESIRTNLSDDNGLRKDIAEFEVKYTQRDWDRTVGWGSVPEKYKLKKNEKK
tara:strand:+ start:31 stop:210 length:180 start_codon:yes stop_codon:yes gene_type:complete